MTSEERSGSVSSPSRGTTPTARKKSTSPKALSHKTPVLVSPPRRSAHPEPPSKAFLSARFNLYLCYLVTMTTVWFKQWNDRPLPRQVSHSSTPPAHPHSSTPQAHPHSSTPPFALLQLWFLGPAELFVSSPPPLVLPRLPPERGGPDVRLLPSELPAVPVPSRVPQRLLSPPPVRPIEPRPAPLQGPREEPRGKREESACSGAQA